MSVDKLIKRLKSEKIAFVDFRFTDMLGISQHVTVPAAAADKHLLTEGKCFDGSSIAGWRGIESSDMVMRPDLSTAVRDPFAEEPTLILFCDIFEPDSKNPYNRCPRGIAAKAMRALVKSGIGDGAIFAPEPEFFVFDSVQWENEMGRASYRIVSEEAVWSSPLEMEGFNSGHRPGVKGGYFPAPPVDSLSDLRGEMCLKLNECGITTEVHHHEVATAGQCEIGVAGGPPVRRGDEAQLFKYVVHNVAHQFGKTATFMPKPLSDDNGNGMHVHQSVSKKGRNIFAGNNYAGMSREALWYIGGVLKHARALNAFANPTTNSYKRLLPGFEAPVNLTYSAKNRSAAVRIPHVTDPKARRFEVRFPDPAANAYLCFASMLLAGMDGIKNRIDPGKPADYNLYARRRAADQSEMRCVCATLPEALSALDGDRTFLTASGVFDDDMIDAYIALKMSEVDKFRKAPLPVEFEMYYSL